MRGGARRTAYGVLPGPVCRRSQSEGVFGGVDGSYRARSVGGVGPGVSVGGKSKVAAGLLAIFLGWLGIHKFYLGYLAFRAVRRRWRRQ